MEERATAMRLLGVEPRFMHHRFIPKDEFSRLLDAGARRDQAPPRLFSITIKNRVIAKRFYKAKRLKELEN